MGMKMKKAKHIPIYHMTVTRCIYDNVFQTNLAWGRVRDEYGSVHSCNFLKRHELGEEITVTDDTRFEYRECRIVRGDDGIYHIV